MNQLFISQLCLEAIIGVYPEERLTPQPIELDIELTVDIAKAAANDRLTDALDYDQLIKQLQVWVSDTGKQFHLIETLAHYLAENILQATGVSSVRLRLSKFPRGLPVASVGVVVTLNQ